MNEISIDSLKVRIPIENVTIVNQSIFGSKFIVDGETGLIESEYKQKRHTLIYDGITTSFGIESQVNKDQRLKKYLVLLFNSKLLHEDYFDGIQSKNISIIYNRIIGLNQVRFSFESFMNAESTDVDWKLDSYNDNFDLTIKKLFSHSKESKKVNEGCNAFRKPTNKGIEYGHRDTATISKPFLKFYHKGLELTNSKDMFYRKYLKHSNKNISNLVRCETTVKNKKHFRKLGINDTTLGSLLSLENDVLELIINKAIKSHLEPRTKSIKTTKEMTPSDNVFYNAIILLMDKGNSYNLIRESLVQNNDKVAKSRLRAKLDTIYNDTIKGSDMDGISQKQTNYFNSIGWY